jgi:UDP-N-acetylmuramate dehydrogenase
MTKTAPTTLGVKDFLESKGIPFQRNVPLRTLSTWKIGGPADFLVEPSLEKQIREILVFCGARKIPYVVIGKGSNLLFEDAGLRGFIIRIDRHFSTVSVRENAIVAQSGVFVPRLARFAWRYGLSGLEHTVGIPGNLGGLLTMNGGSQRQNIGNCVKHVWGISTRGKVKVFNNEACFFEYRKSIFQSLKVIITKVELELKKKCNKAIRQDMLSVLRSRRDRFPRKEPNCGSVFKIDPGLYETVGPPGKIIEEMGLKGFRIGNAEVSRRHANFIINKGGATSKDVLSLIGEIKSRVMKRFAVDLICEVILVDTEGKLTPAGAAS